jgi:hypothetical protein
MVVEMKTTTHMAQNRLRIALTALSVPSSLNLTDNFICLGSPGELKHDQ